MFSNLPVMLQQQDFQARHSDMLAAARSGFVYPKGMKVGRQIRVHLNENIIVARWSEFARNAKIGTTLRIRLPSDYAISDGSPCKSPTPPLSSPD